MAKVNFTAERVASFEATPGKTQTIYWDAKAPGLGLRVTSAGARAYIFESRLFGKTVRITIGDARAWLLGKARTEAARLKTVIDDGKDPREQVAEQRAAHEARKAEARRQDVTLADAWTVYIEERRQRWSELHYRDHVDLSSLGGQPKKRGKGLTEPGPLAALLSRKLTDLNAACVGEWLASEATQRPSRARLAFNLLRIFATWCESKAEYRALIDPQAVSTRQAKDTLPKATAKTDTIQREQLPAWFGAVRQLSNPVMEAYLIGLLLTGARREELAELRWDDVDFRWRSLHLKDKVEAEGRTIPLTPYLACVLQDLKRINETPPTVRRLRTLGNRGETWKPSPWVFFSLTSADGRLASPNRALHRVCETAGIPPVTLHGLRRAFSSLAEWTETPTGVVAQIMGHKPSATAERHYKVRPLDLLRAWHDKIEMWVLEQAGIDFKPEQVNPGLRVIAGA
ncbi:integrase family protein [Paraburkholderia bonniea]|uniref:tyrosine-type recombinase/integrase n=1 Tax=Paraburkholderia bonniea TaxID=2152891 RepID=UPI0025744614|nr:integrase family protein [Paraburkholderia bonniea]WJF91154.1 integrase family protein [Paraburkholderia bonniea]WJF94469.1 integrase family protein [Paraburkholderia bonniea]